MLRIFEKIVDNYKVDPGKLDSLVLRKGLNLISSFVLFSQGSAVPGSRFTVADPSQGMTLLGNWSGFNNFVEVPFSNGKAVVLGTATFQYASNDMKTLAGRTIDYLQTENLGDLTPPEVTISLSSGNVVLQWDEVPSAQSYNVYASDTPYGTFELLGSTYETSFTLPLTDSYKFFHVTSSTDSIPATK